MEAVLHVKDFAYCKIKIDGADMKPSFNLINHITLQEGFGLAVPVLELNFMDASGSLQNELNLLQGAKCTITMGQSEKKQMYKGIFSLWGLERYTDSEGPALKALFILDVPKWTAGVYCENFRSTSDAAMGVMAGRAGMTYSGPGGTQDKMNWLNINTTRSSFSEDIAMRGYVGLTGCMARIVTLNKEVRYKNLFAELAKSPKETFLLNKQGEGIAVRETVDTAISSVFAHWFNYGQSQHEHTLDIVGQKLTNRFTAPKMGDKFPINKDIKGELDSVTMARVTYTGWDPGTEGKPQSNIHENYEKAYYQNLRGLGLFSEKIRTLSTLPTGLSTFDCVMYSQKDPAGQDFKDSRSRNGKYLIAGKTIRLKNGHHYSEVLDLIRPYQNAAGEEAAGAAGQNSKANAGKFNLAAANAPATNSAAAPAAAPPEEKERSPSEAPLIDRSEKLMDSLIAYGESNPALPTKPLGPPGTESVGSESTKAQQDVIDSVQDIHSDANPISDGIKIGLVGTDVGKLKTVKRISAPMVTASANDTLGAIAQDPSHNVIAGAETAVQVEKPVLDRYTEKEDVVLKKQTATVVSTATASAKGTKAGDNIGDIGSGGVLTGDLDAAGAIKPEGLLDAEGKVLPNVDSTSKEQNKGANFMMPAKKFDVNESDVLINPNKTAAHFNAATKGMEEPNVLAKEVKEPSKWKQLFDKDSPNSASAKIKRVQGKATKVQKMFDVDEVLAGPKIGKVVGAVDTASKGIVRPGRTSDDMLTDINGRKLDRVEGFKATTTKEILDKTGLTGVIDTHASVSHKVAKVNSVSEELQNSDAKGVVKVTERSVSEYKIMREKEEQEERKQAAANAKKVVVTSNPNTTVKSSVPSGLILTPTAELDEQKKQENALYQPFAFQYGDDDMEPLVENVVDVQPEPSDPELTRITTDRETVSWPSYTGMGVVKASKNDNYDGYWDFPTGDPYDPLAEKTGETDENGKPLNDTTYLTI